LGRAHHQLAIWEVALTIHAFFCFPACRPAVHSRHFAFAGNSRFIRNVDDRRRTKLAHALLENWMPHPQFKQAGRAPLVVM